MKTLIYQPLQRAFTLIELMIVVAIIAILATIAIPSYTSYTQKAAMSEMLRASSAYKSEVEICAYNTGAITNCSAGSNGIQAAKTTATKYVASTNVNNGAITVTGTGTLNGYSYILTPTFANGNVTWSATCTGTDASIFPAGFCN